MSLLHTAIQTAVIQAAEHAADQAETVHEAVSHPPELPNFVHMLHEIFPGSSLFRFLWQIQDIIFILIIIGVITLFFRSASRNISMVPKRLQALAEMILEGLLDIVCGILGEKEGRRYFPFLGSLFIFIICMNWFGLIPFMKSPSSNILVTASLAICVFCYVQYTAVKRLGVKGFVFHLMGEPKDLIGWLMTPLFLPLHVLEELIKPLSLACRLYGNVYGEDVLLGVGMVLGIAAVAAFIPGTIIGFPLHFPFVLLAILLSAIQALVFTLLATVYISMVLPHEHHEEEE
ncbi:MAG: F0F1 ATP synthase subunit A [Candidatus Omnitrophica bacterium]|nr:F0F1 ATP synthase subunit A [Candidatus Omnitrophota bacterium]